MSAEARARLEELLADRALVGLSSDEERELEARLAEAGGGLDPEFELAAAALDLALVPRADELPARLRARLAVAGRELVVTEGPSPARGITSPRSWFALSGWLVAAAACVLALLLVRAGPSAPDPAAQRAELLARADTLRLAWTATELASGASGDVAWSQALQRGVLRVQGLAANDPTVEQYQFWIIDEAQEHPIDGGVFDVTVGEVLIPIDAKLRVQKPTLFAVTREKPGGVVVSDQKRIVLVAKM